MDPDQLASSEASLSGSTLFTRDLQKPADQDPYYLQELISGFILFLNFFRVKCLSTEKYKLMFALRHVKFAMDMYIMAIYLSLDK